MANSYRDRQAFRSLILILHVDASFSLESQPTLFYMDVETKSQLDSYIFLFQFLSNEVNFLCWKIATTILQFLMLFQCWKRCDNITLRRIDMPCSTKIVNIGWTQKMNLNRLYTVLHERHYWEVRYHWHSRYNWYWTQLIYSTDSRQWCVRPPFCWILNFWKMRTDTFIL